MSVLGALGTFGEDVATAISALLGKPAPNVPCEWIGPGMPANLPSGPAPDAESVRCRFQPDLGMWTQAPPPSSPSELRTAGPWVPTGRTVRVWDRELAQYRRLRDLVAEEIGGRCTILSNGGLECRAPTGPTRWGDALAVELRTVTPYSDPRMVLWTTTGGVRETTGGVMREYAPTRAAASGARPSTPPPVEATDRVILTPVDVEYIPPGASTATAAPVPIYATPLQEAPLREVIIPSSTPGRYWVLVVVAVASALGVVYLLLRKR